MMTADGRNDVAAYSTPADVSMKTKVNVPMDGPKTASIAETKALSATAVNVPRTKRKA